MLATKWGYEGQELGGRSPWGEGSGFAVLGISRSTSAGDKWRGTVTRRRQPSSRAICTTRGRTTATWPRPLSFRSGEHVEIKQGLRRIEALDVEATRRDAELAGYTTFVLPESGIVDRASFFDAVRATFPLDPPLMGSRSWDALSDCLWEGLYAHAARRIAILWPSTRVMANSASDDFEIALNVLADVANSLADPLVTRDNPKEVAVLVE